MKSIKYYLSKALTMILITTVICGVIYPVVITGAAQIFFNNKANGSVIEVNGKKYGSELLAQQFTEDKYMWGRIMNPNISTYKDKDGSKMFYSEPSNLSPAESKYKKQVADRVCRIKESNPDKKGKIPVDLVTCSGSGLDPAISVNAAEYQVARIAKSRGIPESEVEDIIKKYTNKKFLNLIGEDNVNVLKVNLALDGILKK